MIKLTEIKRTSEKISCIAFIENCRESVCLSYDIKNGCINNTVLPKGYEWCTAHIRHAERYMKSISEEKQLPSEKTIMWY